MFALEIINALNDPDNPAKLKGPNAKLKNVSVVDGETELDHRPNEDPKRVIMVTEWD